MPVRSANVKENVYEDVKAEMLATNRSYSFVVNRRLEKLMEIERNEKHV